MSSTIRPDGTLRSPSDKKNNGGTQRPDNDIKPFDDEKAAQSGTQRPAATGNRPQQSGTQRPDSGIKPFDGGNSSQSGTQRPATTGNRPQQSGTQRPGSGIKPFDGGNSSQSGTQRPATTGNRPQQSGTQRPGSGIEPFDGGNSSQSGTKRPATADEQSKKSGTQRPSLDKDKQQAANKQQVKAADIKVLKRDEESSAKEFVLNGVVYTVEGLISSSTGEAEVYKLSKGGNLYALKLYYCGYSPDPEVIKILKGITGTGFLVDIIDAGTWTSPQGEVRDYELQPYYSGGELTAGAMKNKAEVLKATAAGMIMAVKVAHDHNILHKDIKPGNFFYCDESHSQIILADFGIASAFKRDSSGTMIPLKAYAQWRTKIYAAPEIYTAIDGEIEYPDEKSDYYSLGMSLLTLWIGEKPFENIDERAMIRLKRGESGTLPYPDDMPQQLLHLIKGLTVPNPEKRWGFNEFERWARGENVPVEDNSRPSASGLNILYNGSKNQVATSKEELAAFMMDDTKLAEQYLYSGKISNWMLEAGYPEVQIQIDEIINKLYPKSRYSGVMAVCYLLDAGLPFIGIKGDKLNTNAEIADDIANNPDEYQKSLVNTDAPLYVFFNANGINLADKFLPIFKKNSWHAVWQLVFTLDPAHPFPYNNPESKIFRWCDSVEEIIDAYASGPMDKFTDLGYRNRFNTYCELMLGDAFFLWLAHRDPALAGKIKSKLSGEKDTKGHLIYYLLYLLDPELPYELDKNADSKHFNAAQIGVMVNTDLLMYYIAGREEGYDKFEKNLESANMLVDCRDNRIYYYLKSKDVYKDKLDYLYYCFDLESKDNKRKAGPYDVNIAIFKAIKALAGDTFYFFPKSGNSVSSLDELKDVPMDEQQYELQNGLLRHWLAVQFQEDPFADLSEEYSYENLLAEYTIALSEIDPGIEELQRFNDACDDIQGRVDKIKRNIRSIRIIRGVWYLLVALPLLLIGTAYFIWGVESQSTSVIAWKWVWLPILSLAIPLRFLQIVPAIENGFTSLFGEKLGDALTYHRWITSVLIAAVPILLFKAIDEWGGEYGFIFMSVICLAVLWVQFYKTILSCRLYIKSYDNEINPDVEAGTIEPLFYAWKDKDSDAPFESSIEDDQTFYNNALGAIRRTTLRKIFSGLVYVILIFSLWSITSPASTKLMQQYCPGFYEMVRESMEGSAAQTSTYQVINVKSSLMVREKPTTSSTAIGSLRNGQKIEVYEIVDGFARIKYGDREGYVKETYLKLIND